MLDEESLGKILTSTLKLPIWNPVNPSFTVSTSPPVEETMGTCERVVCEIKHVSSMEERFGPCEVIKAIDLQFHIALRATG